MAVVTSTDRPKSVRNRSVIEVFVAFLCCRVAFLDISVGVRSRPFSLEETLCISYPVDHNLQRCTNHHDNNPHTQVWLGDALNADLQHHYSRLVGG